MIVPSSINFLALFTVHCGASTCKSVPGSPGWPSVQSWTSLNRTLDGALLAPLPPAVFCDPKKPEYNTAACAFVGTQWINSSFHASNPVSVDWPNWQLDACLPTNGSSCNTIPFPRYVVNATSGRQVAEAVKFAGENNVRLTVKGTGHDYLGRSTGEGLSIWTHNLRGLSLNNSFVPQSCRCAPQKAFTIAAGQRMGEAYEFATANNFSFVGGADADVGIGGYMTGGGHSPISAKFGLAADNALEMEIVTPSGDIVVANECQNSDLFWAMRGGGGTTFGVLTSVTVKTYPMLSLTAVTFSITSTLKEATANNNDNWYSVLAYFFTQAPALAKAGLMGYSYAGQAAIVAPYLGLTNDTTPAPMPNTSVPMLFVFNGWVLESGPAALDSISTFFSPVLARINATHDAVIPHLSTTPNLTSAAVASFTAGVVGANVFLTSRLWNGPAVANESSLVETFRVIAAENIVNANFVSAPGVHQFKGDSIAATPAWRDAYAHVIVVSGFPYRDPEAEALAAEKTTNVLGKALRQQAPRSGCYLNEADVREPQHQDAFWGSNFERLLEIKNKYDPKGVFWCAICVGEEEWEVRPDGEICSV